MNAFVESLLWVAWGVVCFLSGGWLIGPSIYHRQLREAIRRRPPEPAPIDDDAMLRIIQQNDRRER